MLRELQSTLNQKGFFTNSQNKHFQLSKVPKQKWINLTYMDRILARNQIKTEDFDEEANAIPFFMDFGDSMLQKMKEQVEGKFLEEDNKGSKIIKKRSDNEFLDESLNDLERLLTEISPELVPLEPEQAKRSRSACDSLFALLKRGSSFEIDHFFKQQSMFEPENCLRFVKLFSTILDSPSDDFDFKCVLLKTFLESAADQLMKIREQSPIAKTRTTKSLSKIKSVLDSCQAQNEQSFAEVASVLERIVNQWKPEEISRAN